MHQDTLVVKKAEKKLVKKPLKVDFLKEKCGRVLWLSAYQTTSVRGKFSQEQPVT